MSAESRESWVGRLVNRICFGFFIGGILFLMLGQLKISLFLIAVFALIVLAERLLSPGAGTWSDLRIATVADTVALLSMTFAFVSILWGAYAWMGIFCGAALAGLVVSAVKKPL